MAGNARAVVNIQAHDNASPVFQKVNREMRKTEKQGKVLNQQLRFMRGGFGQVGHQIQDVAVQLQMGQNAMLVFGQQGSQIASLFGPQGAMIGALVAVGAAVSMAVAPAFFGATEAMKEAEDATEDLALKLNDLTGAQRALAAIQLAEQIKQTENALNKQTKSANRTASVVRFAGAEIKNTSETEKEFAESTTLAGATVEALQERLKLLQNVQNGLSPSFEKIIQKVKDETDAIGKSDQAIALAKISRMDLTSVQRFQLAMLTRLKFARAEEHQQNIDANEQQNTLNESYDKTVAKLEQQLAAFTQTEAQVLASKNTQEDFNGVQKFTIALLARNIAIAKEKAEQEKEDQLLKRKSEELFEKTNQSLQTEIDTFGQSAIAIRRYNIEKSEMTRVSKDALLAQLDELAVLERAEEARDKQAKSDQERAEKSAKALADQAQEFEDSFRPAFDEFGDGFVDAITGAENFAEAMKGVAKSVVDSLIKMAVQKLIVDQLFGAFEAAFGPVSSSSTSNSNRISMDGGGYTGRGPRSGGVDGKGGFAAILHPNETVIDHTKGQSNGIIVQQTINVTTGVQQTVRAEIVQLMPQIAQAAKGAVADARLRGGNFSKAMAGA